MWYEFFNDLVVTDHAKTAQLEARDFLVLHGYAVAMEVNCPYAGRNGRIDLVATKNGIQYPIEFDRVTPRKKSIVKLQLFCNTYPNAVPIILLRHGRTHTIENICVISIKTLEGEAT